jgi:hypothetical protein
MVISLAEELCNELKTVLNQEIELGNEIVETSKGFPPPDGIFVMLAKPFKLSENDLPPAIKLTHLNDPHWWKSEYSCPAHRNQLIACRFD